MQRGIKHASREIETLPYSACPAKTYQTVDGRVIPGRSVREHCRIVGEVARALIQRYPEPMRSALFPEHSPLIAACHDIGKVSPAFVEKIRRACTEGTNALAPLPVEPTLEIQWGGHAGVSQVATEALQAPRWVPEILGQHHGFSPQVAGKKADAEVFGGASWQRERSALLSDLKTQLAMEWPEIASTADARLLAGLTTVADWIGSGDGFEDPSLTWQKNIEPALNQAGFVTPTYQAGLSFQQVFNFSPRPAQQQLINAVSSPGVYVLEAPMGLGKTEAALYAAYNLLQEQQATGIYFALPTQLTSNRIYKRFNDFLGRILDPACPNRRALLLHGKSWLLETEMGEEGRPGGAWFSQTKRGLLAPFAVGTVDQALMAAMNVKHGFVRAFGLAGKVVILDEVHSYDAYTGTLLDALVDLLHSLHCTVIILSATLIKERRAELLRKDLISQAYPLVTAIRNQSAVQELPVVPPQNIEIGISLVQDDKLAVREALDRASLGQQVLWIENTVGEAQQRFLDLASRARELGAACGLLHSRFTAADRQRIEKHWVDLFGKEGWTQRPEQGRILVGTQVLEQSLDIDADFLVSRWAPTDMLLQRLGRLWRHAETPRAKTASCQAWFLAPDLTSAVQAPTETFGSTAFVYAPYVLCRSLEVWLARDRLVLPRDTRDLLEDTYNNREEQGPMARWLHELDHGTSGHHHRKGRLALKQLARIGLAQNGKTLPEAKAQTRYSEGDNHEVLLLRSVRYIADEKIARLTLLDEQEVDLPTQRHRLGNDDWKKLTARLMQWMVPVRAADSPMPLARDTMQKLGFGLCFNLGDPTWSDDESLLRLAIVERTGQLTGLHGATVHEKHRLEYHPDIGYLIRKD